MNNKIKKLKWLAEADLTKIILASVATVGFITLATAVPGVLQIVSYYQKNRKRYLQAKYINQRLEKLIKQGLIEIINDDGEKKLSLTIKGETELEKGRLLVELENKKWDGKWRVVSFDILENAIIVARIAIQRSIISINAIFQLIGSFFGLFLFFASSRTRMVFFLSLRGRF